MKSSAYVLENYADFGFAKVGDKVVYKRVNFLVVEDVVEISVHSLGEIVEVAYLGGGVDVPQVADGVVVDALEV